MKNISPPSKEVVIREYPNSTYWIEGRQVIAMGNLVLTNKRLLFLKQVSLTPQEIEKVQKLSKEAATEKVLQFALSLHRRNLEVPLSSIISVKAGLYSIFPILNLYMRVVYKSASKKIKTVSFKFRPPFLKRLLMSDTPTLGWVWDIRKAMKKAQKPP